MSARADGEIELAAIVTDIQDGHLPVSTVLEEMHDAMDEGDERRTAVLARAVLLAVRPGHE